MFRKWKYRWMYAQPQYKSASMIDMMTLSQCWTHPCQKSDVVSVEFTPRPEFKSFDSSTFLCPNVCIDDIETHYTRLAEHHYVRTTK